MAGGPHSSPILQHEMADRAANTSARRMLEEYETTRARLADQHFSMINYPDPLAPRDKQAKAYPPGVTAEMDRKWHEMIEQSRK
ncbi:hypothetical protein FALBO_15435 [Fusarium albosuccineum]|uniref:Uncharacterized protein n=1 Tax=Fusarium albosuccineum TaxID=1237068 RepID=A0A8H4KV88_9HYPO|nr:hypothetical protein FALBO_15435 [Fusarium albosuccineum]